MDSLKFFWIKFAGIVILLAMIAGGIWYWQSKPEVSQLHPSTLALSSDEKTAFLASYEGLGVFDDTTEKLSILPGSFSPSSFVFTGDDGKIYIADGDNSRVSIYQDGKLLQDLAGFVRPRHVFLDEKNNKVFIYDKDSQKLTVLSSNDYKPIKTFNIGDIYGGVFDGKGNKLYLAESYKNRLAVVDGDDFSVKYFSVGRVPNIKDVGAFDEINQRLYILSREDNNIWTIDTGGGEVLNNTKIELSYAEKMTSNAKKDKLYLADTYNHAVLVFDAKNLSTKKIQLSPLLYPIWVLADEESGRIYVYNQSRVSEITVLDMDGKVIKSIPLGYFLSDFKFSSKTKTLYATSNSGGFLMTLKADGNPKFHYKKPEIIETKMNWPKNLAVGGSKTLYVLSDFSNSYLAFEPQQLKLNGELLLGGGPYSTIFTGGDKGGTYIVNKAVNEIWHLNPTHDGEISVNKKIKIEEKIKYESVLREAKKIYIVTEKSIIVINSDNDEVVKNINVKNIYNIIGVDQDSGKVFVNVNKDSVVTIDGNSDVVENTVKINGVKIYKTAFDRSNQYIYVLGDDNKSLIIIDTNKGRIIKNQTLEGSYREISVAPWAKKIYLLDSVNNKLLVLDNGSFRKIALVDLNNPDGAATPSATAIYPNEKASKIYIAHKYGQITVVDSATNKITKTIPLPYNSDPVSLQVDPDLKRFYIANKNENKVSIYSTDDYTLQAEINAQGNTHWLVPQQ